MIKRKALFSIISAIFLLATPFLPEGRAQEAGAEERIAKIEREMITGCKYGEALEELAALLKDDPGEPRIYMDLGIAHYGLMEYDKALLYLKRSDQGGPKKESRDMLDYALSAMDEHGRTLEELEGYSAAMSKAGEAERISLKEKLAIGHYWMIEKLTKQKYYYPALVIAHLFWLKENLPENSGIYELSADVYYSAMYYRKASEDYKKAIEEDAEDGSLYRRLADCLVAVGDLDSAQEYYDKGIEVYRKEGLKNNDPALLYLKRVRKALPRRYDDIEGLIKGDRLGEAEAICRRRISLNPGDYVAITQLAEIYWLKRDIRKAKKLLRKVTRLVPDYPVARFILSRVYFFDHKHDRAIAEFRAFKEKMELLPNMSEAVVDFYISALHNMSYLYSTLKRYDLMLEECLKAAELKPGNQTTHFNLAVCYYNHLRDSRRAYSELKKIIEIDSNTDLAGKAALFIDYMRRNPDPRFIPDFSFILSD